MSMQVGGAQCFVMSQTRDTQSAFTRHERELAQGAQGPPQSTSVSVVSLVAFWQVGETHRMASQSVETQSVETVHGWPLAQAGQAGPPQSTPVSAPFFAASVQSA
jgi:hypothetical protein